MNNDDIATDLLGLAKQFAVDALKESRWYKTAPVEYKINDPEIMITGIEYHEVHTSVGGLPGGSYLAPFIAGETMVGRITAKFRFRAEFGAGGFVIEEQ